MVNSWGVDVCWWIGLVDISPMEVDEMIRQFISDVLDEFRIGSWYDLAVGLGIGICIMGIAVLCVGGFFGLMFLLAHVFEWG